VAKGALRAPFATPASFPHLHCPQAQVCAVADIERGQSLACFSTLSGVNIIHPVPKRLFGRLQNVRNDGGAAAAYVLRHSPERVG